MSEKKSENKSLVTSSDHSPAVILKFGKDEIDLIKESKAPGSTQAEFNLFIYDAQARGLNPLKNEIHFVKRGDKATHQVGIDGFRIIAQRSGEYGGQTHVEYGPIIEVLGMKVPEYAEVGVYRKGFEHPLYTRAYFEEYVQVFTDKYKGSKVGSMWAKMPRLMLAKCAEALAIRKAFPDHLAGLYTPEEMNQSDTSEATVKDVTHEPDQELITELLMEFESLAVIEKWDSNTKKENMQKMFKGKKVAEIPTSQIKKIIEILKRKVKESKSKNIIEHAEEVFEAKAEEKEDKKN